MPFTRREPQNGASDMDGTEFDVMFLERLLEPLERIACALEPAPPAQVERCARCAELEAIAGPAALAGDTNEGEK